MKKAVFSQSPSMDAGANDFFRSLERAGAENLDYPGCMQTITAEHDRLNNPDGPCDDGRASVAA